MSNISIDITTPTLNYNRSEVLTKFFNDMRKYPLLSKGEEEELFKKIKSGNSAEAKKARNKIIISNLRFVVSVAKKYANKTNLVDLINEGNIGLMIAVDKFDYLRDNKFMSYAVHYIRREIITYMQTSLTMINKRPLARINGPLNEIKSKYWKREQRTPTKEEIEYELKDKYNIKSHNFEDNHFSSIDESPDEYGNFGSFNAIQEYNEYTGNTNSFISKADNDYNKEIANVLLTHARTKRDKEILKMKYGIGFSHAFSNTEIAKKLNITSERVRQIDEENIKHFRTICKNHKIKAMF